MKPYGHAKEDHPDTERPNCPCCTTQYDKHRNCRKVTDKKRRKTARQEAKIEEQRNETN